MTTRAAELVERLELMPHPEGGYYREVFRAAATVQPADDRPPRPALTTIYFLLHQDAHSRWHRVRSDEVWHHYEGDRLELLMAAPDFETTRRVWLGPVDLADDEQRPVAVVPAGWWQTARSLGSHTLVGCTVGPGFDFADFAMLRDDPEAATALRQRHPDLATWL